MDKEKAVEILEKWDIPTEVKVDLMPAESRHYLHQWLEKYRKGVRENLFLTEDDDLESCSSFMTVGWLFWQMVREDLLQTFIYRINAVTHQGLSGEDFNEMIGKVRSADIVWVEELMVSELTATQRTVLYSFLTNILSKSKTLIISTSVSAETVVEYVGGPIAKLITRNMTLIQV